MINIIRCGALTTVQDLGRHGYRHLGVSQCGALDPIAMQQANLLLGNALDAAVLEISVGPLVLRFTEDCAIALSGSCFSTALEALHEGSHMGSHKGSHKGSPEQPETKVLPGHPCLIRAGDTLTLSKPYVPGARCYLAITGGIDVPLLMDSRSTDLNARFGGLHGRALQAGDQLATGKYPAHATLARKGIRPFSPPHILRALPGPEHDDFTVLSQKDFWDQPWRIGHQSNRMGLRLSGRAVYRRQPLELPSAGVLPGDVQVPPNGLPIVLANDAQTIGGYPRIACVIKADLWQLAHMPPGTSVFFQQVTVAQSRAAAQQHIHYFQRLQHHLRDTSR